MPFNSQGVYSPASGATTAVPGGLIQSSVWNGIFSDITSALTTVGTQIIGSTAVSTTPYSPLTTDTFLLVTTSGGAVVINLPAASSRSGLRLRVKDLTGNANTNNITINRNGADTIEGLTSLTINTAYGGYTLFPVTGGWILSP